MTEEHVLVFMPVMMNSAQTSVEVLAPFCIVLPLRIELPGVDWWLSYLTV